MINKIIEFSVRNRFMVIAIFVLIVLFGFNSMRKTSVDAIPDIGELQIIVYADWQGRSPKDVEDQVTYPLTTNLMGTPKVKVVRSTSAFGFAIVNMIFEEGTDYYWARTRVLEKLDFAKKDLPADAEVRLGPDATALGQIFWYTLESKNHDLEELRSIQDWYIRYQLTGVQGVSEVASVGGYVKQYQIDIDPNKLLAYDIGIDEVITAVQKSNIDVGAKVFEQSGVEFIVRGLGFIKNTEDIGNIVIAVNDGVPIYVKTISNVTIGADFRRGALDKEGTEVVGAVVNMRYGENPTEVIKRVKAKIKELSVGLPAGVKIVPFYDRSEIVSRSINTLRTALVQEILVTIFVIMFFLLHFRASLIVSMILPIGILISFILMRLMGISANIMSLGGLAIAIGVMVDSGCVLIENIYRRLSEKQTELKTINLSKEIRLDTCIKASQEVGKPVFFALLTTIISFLPIFALTGQAGKLFIPLAYTKTFAITGAAIIAIFLLPVLAYYLLKGKLTPDNKNKTTVYLQTQYRNIIEKALVNKKKVVYMFAGIMVVGLLSAGLTKKEFMPPLNEGDLLFMPVMISGVSLTQSLEVMQKQNKIIKQIPEVKQVVGKIGRAETATDPAPISMIETIINLKDKKHWRKGMTRKKLINEIIEKTRMPGVSPIMTQPIRNRIDMLATGIQTPVGIKIFGPDINKTVEIGIKIEKIISKVKGAVNPYAERIANRPYFEIEIDRQQAARYGIKIQDVQNVIMTAIGGQNLTTVIEGRGRYPLRIRYQRELRDSPEALNKIYIPTANGEHIPLGLIANLKKVPGPAVINSENTLTYARVFVNIDESKVGLINFVKQAQKVLAKEIKNGNLKIPKGYFISWSGQFESEMESRKKLIPAVLMALAAILLILYFAFNDIVIVGILSISLPISLMGGFILLYVFGFRLSTAVWVGFIALFGIATDNAVVLLSTLNRLFKENSAKTVKEIRALVIKGGIMRVRPAIMTTATTILALIPIMLATGTGAELMKPMAVPTIGGLITATLCNLILIPVIYSYIKERKVKNI